MALRSRSKDALCLVLAVAALVIGFTTFRSQPPRPRAAGPGAKQSVPSEGTAGVVGKAEAADPVKTMPVINGTRNPFTAPLGAPPIRLASAKGSEAKREVEPRVSAEEAGAVKPVPTTALPTFVVASAPGAAVQPAGVAAAPPPPDKPSLSGIVVDDAGKPTAVIHEGDQRYFAKAGDTVAGKYRVQSIGRQQVVLVAGRERLTLKMGGS